MQLTIQLNRRCNFTCSHCCQQMDGSDIDPSICRQWISRLAAADLISRVSFTGGEAFVRYSLLLGMVAHAGESGLPSSVITNGWWGADDSRRERWLDELAAAGLDQLAVSFDPWHEAHISRSTVRHLLVSAENRGMTTFLNIVFTESNKADLERAAREILAFTATFVNFAPCLPVGSGDSLSVDSRTWPLQQIGAACPDSRSAVLYPDGSLKPCCTAGTHDSLGLQDGQQQSPATALRALAEDQYVGAVRSKGPQALARFLTDSAKRTFEKGRYISACHACHTAMELISSER